MISSFKICLLFLILFALKRHAQMVDLKNADWQFRQVDQPKWLLDIC